jgi:hypothetical protein
MKTFSFYKTLLIFLLVFLAAGAFYGGLTLVIRPDGSIIRMPVEMLSGSPFNSFLIPGIILLIMFGVFPIFTIYGLIKKPENKFINHFNFLFDYHFAWTFSVYIGIGQVIWIDIQTLILNEVGLLHIVYSGLGLLIICIALLPGVRNQYKL